MKLGTKGRYAVMAMVDIAIQGESEPVALADIAERQDISLNYLEQLFGLLRKGGQVKSIRGPHGGYVLIRHPSEMRISEIILAVNEPIKATRCKPGSSEGCRTDKGRCLTHDLWEELGNQIYLFLSSISLEDVIVNRLPGIGGSFYINNSIIKSAENSALGTNENL